MEDSRDDATFRNNVILLKVLIALDLELKAAKENNMSQFDCGRIAILPYNFALNCEKYGPTHVKELIQLYYRLMEDAREEHAKYFTFCGKHFDERMEEQNNAQKNIQSDRAPTNARIQRSSLFVKVVSELDSHLNKTFGKNERGYHEQTHKETDSLVRKMAKYLIAHNFFKRIPGREEVFSFDGETVVPLCQTIEAIHQHGINNLRQYVVDYINEKPDVKFPSPLEVVFPKSYTPTSAAPTTATAATATTAATVIANPTATATE
jgi:hypothetical protein